MASEAVKVEAKNLRAFAAAVGVLVGVLELVGDFANMRYLAAMLGSTGNVAAVSGVIAALHIGGAIALYFRLRSGWLLAVAMAGAAMIPVGIVGMTLIVSGQILDALPGLILYGTLLGAQIACYEEMEPSPWPHVEGAVIGGITAVLWLVSGLEKDTWTALGQAGFGHPVRMEIVILFVVIQALLSLGIYLRSRAAWGFALSLAGTLGVPLAIGVTRMMFHKDFLNGAIALFLHTLLMTVQAVALDVPLKDDDEAPEART